MVKLTGGQRIDLLGIRKEDLPGVWADLDMPSGYAYGKTFRTVKTCVGSGVLPLRPRRLHRARHRARDPAPGSGEPGQAEAGGHRLPAQLRRGATSRTSASSPSRAAAGRSTSAAPPERTSARATCSATVDDAETAISAHRPVPAVLPRERELARAHLRLRARGSASSTIRAVVVDDSDGIAAASTPRCKHPSTPTATRGRKGRNRLTPASSGPRCRWRSCPRCRRTGPRACSEAAVVTATTHTGAARRTSTGPARPTIPPGEGRAYAVAGEQVAVFRLRDGSPPRGLGGLPARRRTARRRPDRRPRRRLPAAPERLRPRHRRARPTGARRCRTYPVDRRRRRPRRPPVPRRSQTA